MSKMPSVLMAAALATAAAASTIEELDLRKPILTAEDILEIQRAVFLSMFDDSIRKSEKGTLVLFLRLGCEFKQSPEAEFDSFDQLIATLNQSGWNVRRGDVATASYEGRGYVDRDTGRLGLMYCVGVIERVSDTEARVYGTFYRDSSFSEGAHYVLFKGRLGWEVSSRAITWRS